MQDEAAPAHRLWRASVHCVERRRPSKRRRCEPAPDTGDEEERSQYTVSYDADGAGRIHRAPRGTPLSQGEALVDPAEGEALWTKVFITENPRAHAFIAAVAQTAERIDHEERMEEFRREHEAENQRRLLTTRPDLPELKAEDILRLALKTGRPVVVLPEKLTGLQVDTRELIAKKFMEGRTPYILDGAEVRALLDASAECEATAALAAVERQDEGS
ncbi:hypothetical protein [Salinarimonas soli]|uniref:Uncharacterized protein n=1 Tax=Salinarimonas soli TaxID=1638099 RepID=A0A5B2VBZ3_9HYPH|nr:hypothetical protein [Salinarimonas soli]KAA2236963.1 hypothetical protein F0L46_11870 [Salinarimonas soli]